MKKELVDSALATLNELIADELKSDDRQRYRRVILLSGQAQKLMKLAHRGTRVRDHRMGAWNPLLGGQADNEQALEADAEMEIDLENGAARPLAQYGGVARIGGEPNDMVELMREMFMSLPKPSATNAAATKLSKLLDIRDRLKEDGRDVTGIESQIEIATKQLEEGTSDDQRAHMVHSQLPRRYPAGGDRQDLVHGDRGAGDGAREEGADPARGGGIEEGVVDIADGVAV